MNTRSSTSSPATTGIDHRQPIEAGLQAIRTGRTHDAIGLFEESIRRKPSAAAHYYLGSALHELGSLPAAITHFKTAIQISPAFHQAYNNLALALQDQKDVEGAIDTLTTVLSIKPDYFNALINLASLCQAKGDTERTIDCYERAMSIDPGALAPLLQLGKLRLRRGETTLALDLFQEAVRNDANNPEAAYQLGHCQSAMGLVEEASRSYEKAIQLQPGHTNAMMGLAEKRLEMNRAEEARDWFKRCHQAKPRLLKAIFQQALSLPMVYADKAELFRERERYEYQLNKLDVEKSRLFNFPRQEILRAVQRTNFFLAYQGFDDKELQIKYGALVVGLTGSIYHYEYRKPHTRREGSRPRIGFVSRFLRNCTVGHYFKSWITQLNQAKFDVYIYHLGGEPDSLTQEIRAASRSFKHLNIGLLDTADTISRDDLDVLIFPEIGMDGFTFALASLRTAPVQCCAWGHPVTTGLSSIDYFLSCDAIEPKGAEAHYNERLIKLPGIGTHYEQPSLPNPASRSSAGLPADKILYLFPQSLFKLHPDTDRLVAEILRRNGNAVLVLFEDQYAANTTTYRSRLAAQLSAYGIEFSERAIVLNKMSREDYLRINALCDVMLDSLYWSGGNTTLDALACNLPVVTLPGALMRGRQTAGMLALAEMPELIARSEEEYLEIALRLGKDPTWRQRISDKIKVGKAKIFGQDRPIRALEDFLLQVCQNPDSSTPI